MVVRVMVVCDDVHDAWDVVFDACVMVWAMVCMAVCVMVKVVVRWND